MKNAIKSLLSLIPNYILISAPLAAVAIYGMIRLHAMLQEAGLGEIAAR